MPLSVLAGGAAFGMAALTLIVLVGARRCVQLAAAREDGAYTYAYGAARVDRCRLVGIDGMIVREGSIDRAGMLNRVASTCR